MFRMFLRSYSFLVYFVVFYSASTSFAISESRSTPANDTAEKK